ncbi:hypothetical protein [Streptomyces sp. NBC_01455]|uniref:hypothetical protein n=1 Tax=Streptomyces sp. NBC_01455 TaxID=2903874 RepID=UPI002E35A637|nr:hypothetical protein [Streptomyces sp. NBC_01455]
MSVLASCADLLDALPARSPHCPACGTHAPAWVRVEIDGLSIVTHDGDLICPRDRSFGYTPAPAPALLAVAA